MPQMDAWTPRPWVSVADRFAQGRAARKLAPRRSHAELELPADRDPIAILLTQEHDRLPELLPLRHGRMAADPFAYFRGTPAVMAADLSTDAPERDRRPGQRRRPPLEFRPVRVGGADPRLRCQRLRRDDPAPWEWDVKRLAVSVLIAARNNGFTTAEGREAVVETVAAYRLAQARHAGMRLLDIWYERTSAETVLTAALERAARTKGASVKETRQQIGRSSPRHAARTGSVRPRP